MPRDSIRIHRLRAPTRVGVPDAERAAPQVVELCIELAPQRGFHLLADQISEAVDYYAVSRAALKVAADGERKLIETLAEDIATSLLGQFALAEIGVEVRKFILPETEYVSVRVQRGAPRA